MSRVVFAVTIAGLLCAHAQAKVVTKTVDYTDGDVALRGHVAWDDAIEGKRPGVLVVHEWWGQNAYVRHRADMLAKLGYVALAVDMYGDGRVAEHPSDASTFASEVRENMDVGERRFRSALEVLVSQPDVESDRIGAIGFCFGGGVVLEMARRGLPLAGVVSFHGNLSGLSPVKPGAVKARVLVLNGADDPFIKPDQIVTFKQAMDAAGARYRIISYVGAKHAFTNPDANEYGRKFNLPFAYHAVADVRSWEAMRSLFETVLR